MNINISLFELFRLQFRIKIIRNKYSNIYKFEKFDRISLFEKIKFEF